LSIINSTSKLVLAMAAIFLHFIDLINHPGLREDTAYSNHFLLAELEGEVVLVFNELVEVVVT